MEEQGFWCWGRDTRALAERILDLLADEGLRLQMGGRPWNGKVTFSPLDKATKRTS